MKFEIGQVVQVKMSYGMVDGQHVAVIGYDETNKNYLTKRVTSTGKIDGRNKEVLEYKEHRLATI